MKNVMIILQVLILLSLAGYGYAESNVKPLPNGVVIDGDLSIAIARIEREATTTSVWLAFRKLSEPEMKPSLGRQLRGHEGERVHPAKKLVLRIIDDRGNKYVKWCYEEHGLNEPRDFKKLPCGFTWVVPVEVPKIPQIAPISKIELDNQASEEKLELDFRKPTFPKLDFEIKPEQLLITGKEIQIDKNMSFSANELILEGRPAEVYEQGLYFYLPLTFKNVDYNPQETRDYFLAIQLEDGRLFYGYQCKAQRVEGLSTREERVGINPSFREISKGENSLPRMLFLYELNSRGSSFCRFVPIPAELKQQCLEMQKSYLARESQTSNSQVASSETPNKQPETQKQEKIKEIEKTVKKAEGIYGIFKKR